MPLRISILEFVISGLATMVDDLPCPYFIPPGHCRASSEPSAAELVRTCCEPGYARGRCTRFPEDAAADSVRFVVSKDGEGVIEVRWARELDHEPAGAGLLRHPAERLDDPAMQAQAEAVIEAYLVRKGKWLKN